MEATGTVRSRLVSETECPPFQHFHVFIFQYLLEIMAKIQKRTVALTENIRVREAEEEEGKESRTIEGYALKFGVRSVLLNDWWNSYYEVLEPGCLTKETLDGQDIKLTMFHDRQLILARSNKGGGTLSYEVDEVGVKFWAEMPHTSDGDKALELVRRGDIAGCSFCYSTDEEDSENAVSYERCDEKDESGNSILIRHVKRIDHVYDFTLAADPAFEQTEVSRREVEQALGKPLENENSKPAKEREAFAKRKEKARILRALRSRIK